MQDYAGNSNREKEKKEGKSKDKEKKVEKVVTADVVVAKRSLGRKFKDLIVEADFRSVVHYIYDELVIPSIKNLIVDTTSKGIDRMIYGEPAMRRRQSALGSGPRYSYQSPIYRGGSSRETERIRYAQVGAPVPRASSKARQDFILSSREDADAVLSQMMDIIDTYDAVSVADFNELVGFPSNHVDNKWGWTSLKDVDIRQIREGYLIDLPEPESI